MRALVLSLALVAACTSGGSSGAGDSAVDGAVAASRDACVTCGAPDASACPDATPDSCDGVCVDLQADDANCGGCGNACADNFTCVAGSCTWRGTAIAHVVLIVQENHTFDSYFGRYCTAPAYSNPTCTTGRGCCEAAPDTDPAGNTPYALTDDFNYGEDHDHGYACELCEINGGAMDKWTAGGCPSDTTFFQGLITYSCSSPENYAVADDATLMTTYWGLADEFALADRYFQPLAGGTSGNDMYFAVSHYEFADNDVMPPARGNGCTMSTSVSSGTALDGRTTIADVLLGAGFTFHVYADGYADAYNAYPDCPPPGGDCRESTSITQWACKYDPSDIPFQYYPQFTDDTTYMRDLADFYTDVNAGALPSFSYVKYRTSANEHPEWSYVSDGESNVAQIINAIFNSQQYAQDTLILLTWDEGGGYFDHVTPPASVETYGQDVGGGFAGTPVPYGTRVPMLAIGAFARRGEISHVQMEHSSIVRFLEWNFLGPDGEGAIHATTDAARDALVNNIGSLLDSNAVGVVVP